MLRDAHSEEANSPASRNMSAALAKQRLEPLWLHLKGITHLIVLPSAALAEIPVEALVAARPGGLDRPWSAMPPRVRCLPGCASRGAGGRPASCWPWVTPPSARRAESPPPTPPDHGIAILAVPPNGIADLFGLKAGDVLLEYNGTDSSRSRPQASPSRPGSSGFRSSSGDGEVRTVELSAGWGIQSIPAARPPRSSWLSAPMRPSILLPAAALDPLPGTRREVEAIAAFSPAAGPPPCSAPRPPTGLAAAGPVRRPEGYRFLHLATHGKTNPDVAMSSAVILAPDPDRPADPTALEADGQITAEQIVQTWDLDADLVVLSACETGLGRYAGGEGYLGFAQALFVKGRGASS